jgi:DNA-binding MarR family transcriptional regulator
MDAPSRLSPGPRRIQKDKSRGATKFDVEHLRRLADFRYRLRCFLHVSQAAAEELGLRPQQYQLLQCVGAMPEGEAPTIASVAARMLLKHNSAVELVDRSVEQGLLRRSGDAGDHRRILLRVTRQGERILASLAEVHTRELEQSGPELVRALHRILRGASAARGRRTAGERAKTR